MLTELEFEEWFANANLPSISKEVINRIRTSPPSRNVGGGKYNVWGKYPSSKMGVSIQFESHTVELPAIRLMEFDDDILEFYDQPSRIKLNYLSKSNRKVGVLSTPDFFVISKNEAAWEEWKTEEELMTLSIESPNRYYKDENGIWRCPPGEEYAQQYGLKYFIKSDASIPKIFCRNLNFLEDYILDSRYQITSEAKTEIITIIAQYPGITIKDVTSMLERASVDDLYHLIAKDEIYIDLYKHLIIESKFAELFVDQESYITYSNIIECNTEPLVSINPINIAVGEELIWDGSSWRILNIGSNILSLMAFDNKLIEMPKQTLISLLQNGTIKSANSEQYDRLKVESNAIIMSADKEDLKIANWRYKCIKKMLEKDINDGENFNIPERTRREWLRKYKEAEKKYNNGYIGLIPQYKERGNYNRKLPEDTLKIMKEFIENEYRTSKQKTRMVVFGQLQNECEKQGILIPSYKTFCQEINKYPTEDITRDRLGERAAYQHEAFYWEINSSTPRHGDRAFEICHIDHTEVNIELIDSETGKNLDRPWLTTLLDAHTRRFLAVHMTFDPPSYRSDMMVLRECVKRFNRLPQTIVVDGGKDFHSIYFESLLAMFKVTKKTRPAAKARFGSIIERLFDTTQDEFIHNLQGNTQIMRNVRQVTKSINPKNTAIWTFEAFSEMMRCFCYEIYDTDEHSTLGQSPREAFESDIKKCGNREFRFIPYDENFYIMTLPAPTRETVKVQPSRGVKINYINYWTKDMKNPHIENQKVQVRYDPFNLGIAYAYLNKSWVKCCSEYYSVFQGKSEKWLKCVVEEIRQKNKRSQNKLNISAKKIASFISEAEQVESILKQSRKDEESIKRNLKEIEQVQGNKEIATTISDESCENEFDIDNIELEVLEVLN